MTDTTNGATLIGFEKGKYPYSDRMKRGDMRNKRLTFRLSS